MELAIRIQQLQKSFGSQRALAGLNLEVAPGAVCALLGPNGAGKTTTLRTLLGLLQPDGGIVEALGLNCWTESVALRRRMSYLSADMRFYPWMTTVEALKLAEGLRERPLLDAGLVLAERLGLASNRPAGELSRGNLQKMGLVLALAAGPELLLLDEPSSGLDPLVQETFVELIQEACDSGTTVFLSSHTFAEVDRLAQQVVVIKEGRAVVSETLASFRARAGRKVELLFREEPPQQGPEGLSLTGQDERRWRGVWHGSTEPLIQWCAEQAMEDVEISAPLLDDAFLDFYR